MEYIKSLQLQKQKCKYYTPLFSVQYTLPCLMSRMWADTINLSEDVQYGILTHIIVMHVSDELKVPCFHWVNKKHRITKPDWRKHPINATQIYIYYHYKNRKICMEEDCRLSESFEIVKWGETGVMLPWWQWERWKLE